MRDAHALLWCGQSHGPQLGLGLIGFGSCCLMKFSRAFTEQSQIPWQGGAKQPGAAGGRSCARRQRGRLFVRQPPDGSDVPPDLYEHVEQGEGQRVRRDSWQRQVQREFQ